MVKEGDSPIASGATEYNSDPSEFMKMLGLDAVPIGESKVASKRTTGVEDPMKSGVTASDTEAMKEILAKFNTCVETEVDLTLRSKEGKSLERAMITESYSDKEWHVKLNENRSFKSYTVLNNASSKSFFENLVLYKTAKKICVLLEQGYAVNSKIIQKVLYYDNLYANHFNECRNFKRLHKKALLEKNSSRINILSDKFEVSRDKALNAKSQIARIR